MAAAAAVAARRTARLALAAPRRAARAVAAGVKVGNEALRVAAAQPAVPGGTAYTSPTEDSPAAAGTNSGAAAAAGAAVSIAAAAAAWRRWGTDVLRRRARDASEEGSGGGAFDSSKLFKTVLDEPTASFLAKLPDALQAVDDAYYSSSENAERLTFPREMRALKALAREFPLETKPGGAPSRLPYAEALSAARRMLPAPSKAELALGARMLTFAEAAYEAPSVIHEACRAEGYEVLYVEPISRPGAPAHFLAFSPHAKTAVLSVRGTNTVADVLTDLVHTVEPIRAPGASAKTDVGADGASTAAAVATSDVPLGSDSDDVAGADGVATAHGGMLGAALHVVTRATPALRELLAPGGYRLIITGHSLGAGTAALAAMMLSSVAAPRSVSEELREAASAAGQAYWRAAEWSAEALQSEAASKRDPATTAVAGDSDEEGSGSDRYGLAALVQSAADALDRAASAVQQPRERWPTPLEGVNCVAFAPPPVVDARTGLASAAVGRAYGQVAPGDSADLADALAGSLSIDALRDGDAAAGLKDALARGAATLAAFGADDAPLVLSFCAREDAVPRTSMRNVRAFAQLISEVDSALESGQGLEEGHALEMLRGSASHDFGMGSRDLLVPGRVVMLASDPPHPSSGEAADGDDGSTDGETWWAVVGSGQSLECLRYAELAPRSISDHMAPVYRLALGAASNDGGRADATRDGGEFKAWLRGRSTEARAAAGSP